MAPNDDLTTKTLEQLKQMLGEALAEAKVAADGAVDHTDPALAVAVGRAIAIWNALLKQ